MGRVRLVWCDSGDARDYVMSRRWESPAGAEVLFTRHRGNVVWRAEIAPFGQVVVKESHLDRSFTPLERIGRELRFRLFNVNMRDARTALAAERLGVHTYHPLAVWEERKGLWTSCYIMYTYVEGLPLDDLCKGGAFRDADRPAVKRHLQALGAIARRLHEGGIRHRDLHPQNIVVRPDGALAVIDFASGRRTHSGWPRLRRTRDFASLRRLAKVFDADCLSAFCLGYCGGKGRDYEHALLFMLYWKYNGSGSGGIHRLRFLRHTKTAYDID